MAKEWARKFYNSKAWQECRQAYIYSQNFLCERCLKGGSHVPGYIVHHKTYLNPSNINDPTVSLNFENLEYVCKTCHDDEHGVGRHGEVTRKGTAFTATGELIRVSDDDVERP